MAVNDCFTNVQKLVETYGGATECGWLLWEEPPGLVLSAEFHAVWIDRNGNRREVTPRVLPVERTVFLPDPKREYQGRQVNNVRVALVDDPLVDEFIDWENRRFELMNEGDLADYHGPISMPESFIEEGRQIAFRLFRKYFSPE